MLKDKFNKISLDEVKRQYDSYNGKLNILVVNRISDKVYFVEVRDIMNNYDFYKNNVEMGWFSLYITEKENENYVNC